MDQTTWELLTSVHRLLCAPACLQLGSRQSRGPLIVLATSPYSVTQMDPILHRQVGCNAMMVCEPASTYSRAGEVRSAQVVALPLAMAMVTCHYLAQQLNNQHQPCPVCRKPSGIECTFLLCLLHAGPGIVWHHPRPCTCAGCRWLWRSALQPPTHTECVITFLHPAGQEGSWALRAVQ